MPKGAVSLERKVLPFNNDSSRISYPDANFWSTSAVPLCKLEVIEGNLFSIVRKSNFLYIFFLIIHLVCYR